MKLKLLLCFLSITYFLSAQTTSIPDPNFEQALITLGHDTVLDGQVLTSNINGIISLDVSIRNINSLQGIEDFTSLSTLVCNDNNLASLDLSNNTNLSFLNAVNNNLTGLLDLSNQTMLGFIWVANNNLTRLNIQNGNNINIGPSEFNTQNNPNLICVQVDDVTYSNTTWTFVDDPNVFRLDCSEIFVPDDNFEQELVALGYDTILDDYVYAFNINSVQTLNVSNKNIADLTGIEGFENLEILACQNNQISTIDLSSNLNLEQVFCNDNNINAVDLSMANGLIGVNVSNNQLSVFNLKNGNNTNISLINALNNPMLQCVEVDDVNYSNANWSSSIDNTASFNSDCTQVFVPDDNFENALISLGYDNVLDDFVFKGNINALTSLNVSLRDIVDLTGIEGFEALENLNCSRNLLTSLNLIQNTNLISLNCNRNDITSLSITDGSGTLQTNLTSLLCGENELTGINTNFYPNLVMLNCANNNINNLNSLFSNSNLQNLVCNNNGITNLNLNSNTLLTELDVRDNQLTSLLIQNGNNTNITSFNSLNNAMLTCIDVDNVAYSTTNWTNVDAQTNFSTNCSLSITEIETSAVKFFPNPTRGGFVVDTNLTINKISIYNLEGKLVKTFPKEMSIYYIDKLASGVYFVNITSAKGNIFKKIIKN